MIIRIKHSELRKFPKPIYDNVGLEENETATLLEDSPFKITYLAQDFGYKGCTYDVIGEIYGDLIAFLNSDIIYVALNDDEILLSKFRLINTPNNIKPKFINDVSYTHSNINKLTDDEIVGLNSASEMRLKLENKSLQEELNETTTQLYETQLAVLYINDKINEAIAN